MKTIKALVYDGISDNWITQTERWDLLNDLWNSDNLQLINTIFEARLVPLNKKFP